MKMAPRALLGAPVGTTGIGNMAVSAMSGQGGGRGTGASGIISGNSAIAETNGGQAKPVTATALSCEASGAGPSCGGLESFPSVVSIQSSGMGGGRGNGSLTGGSEGVGGTMGAAGKIGRVAGNCSCIGGAIGALVGATVAHGRA